MTPKAKAIMNEVNALLNKARTSTVTKKTNRVEVDAPTIQQVSELDMLKAQIQSRPSIVDAASRKCRRR